MSRLWLAVLLAGCLEAPPAATPDAAPPPDAVPVACDGHLCKTDNGGSCNASGGGAGVLVALGAVALRRRRR